MAVCEAADGIGAFLPREGLREWYPRIEKPSFTPPGPIFGPTWTLLYTMTGASLWMAEEWGGAGSAKRTRQVLFGAQLPLDVLWRYVFFGRRAPGWPFAEVVVLLVVIAATAASFWRVSRAAALLLVPYLLWTGFASVQNLSVWRLNR